MAPKKNILSPSTSSSPSPATESDEVRNLVNRALEYIPKDPTRAHKILNDSRHGHASSALFQHQRAIVLYHYAESLNDPEEATRRKKEAVSLAQTATQLSPDNNEYSVAYVRLLLASSEGDQKELRFHEALEECERALAISRDQITDHQQELQFFLNMIKNPILSAHCKRKLAANPKTFKIRYYLKPLTPEEMKELLHVETRDFVRLFPGTNASLDVMKEAVKVFLTYQSLKFWLCPPCNMKFVDSEALSQHVMNEHVGTHSEETRLHFPAQLNQDWVKKIGDGRWDPIDVQAIEMNRGDQKWPVSDDPERSMLLELIHLYFKMLVVKSYLSMSHVDRMLHYAMGQVRLLPSAQVLLEQGVNAESVTCICALDACQLRKVLNYLKSLALACKVSYAAESDESSACSVFLDSPESDTAINVFLEDSGFPYFLLDPQQCRFYALLVIRKQ